MKRVVVLRYGHRYFRDYRVTTHCCLVARAFGAEKILIEGESDAKIIESVQKINKNWGGKFEVAFVPAWREIVEQHKKEGFILVHLTVYGEKLKKRIKDIKEKEKILVLIGSQKVEKAVYALSEHNISITNQPHSEIAALSVFLDKLFEGEHIEKKFLNAKISVVPSIKGKKVIIKK